MADYGVDVLQNLKLNWEFLGANLMEWGSGLSMFFIVSLFGNGMSMMIFMILAMVLTAMTLAGMRRSFPDEERGVRNVFMVACGVPPIGIPAPAALQPIWSQARVETLDPECMFVKLGLDEFFPTNVDKMLQDLSVEERGGV